MVADRSNVEALRIYCFFLLARENDPELFAEKFDELQNALRQTEGRNSDLIYNISRLFARFCGRNKDVVNKTLQLLEIATMLQPDNAAYIAEQAF